LILCWVITSWKYFSEIKSGLKATGYEHLGEAGVPGREYFRKRGSHAFNVHVMLDNSELWLNNILLRNYLITRPEVAKKYAQLKEKAITLGIDMLIAYSEYKSQFISALLKEAQASAS
jgi:GrpB-like predicted nucleotidyltransferase (UPF0157 family)